MALSPEWLPPDSNSAYSHHLPGPSVLGTLSWNCLHTEGASVEVADQRLPERCRNHTPSSKPAPALTIKQPPCSHPELGQLLPAVWPGQTT